MTTRDAAVGEGPPWGGRVVGGRGGVGQSGLVRR